MPADPRRALGPVAAWVVAAVVAVAVASWGVALVGRSVTDSRPAPLSASQVDERLAAASASTTVAGAEPTTTAPVDAGTLVPPASAGPSTTPAPPPSGAGPATTAAPPPVVAPATTAAPPPAGETRTYQTTGGSATLRFEASGVTLVFANPAQGFEVETEPEHGNGLRVKFEGEGHESRIDAWWDGGPQDRVEESGGEGGGDD